MTVRDEIELALRDFTFATAQPPYAFVMGPETYTRVKAAQEPSILVELCMAPTRLCGLRIIVLQGAGGMMVVPADFAGTVLKNAWAREIP